MWYKLNMLKRTLNLELKSDSEFIFLTRISLNIKVAHENLGQLKAVFAFSDKSLLCYCWTSSPIYFKKFW